MELPELVRKLRTAWFNDHLMSYPQEHQWEEEDELEERRLKNERRKIRYDAQTEMIISGAEDYPLLPRCENDLMSRKLI